MLSWSIVNGQRTMVQKKKPIIYRLWAMNHGLKKLSPITFNPNVTMCTVFPSSGYPNGSRTWWSSPIAAMPNVSMPVWHPIFINPNMAR